MAIKVLERCIDGGIFVNIMPQEIRILHHPGIRYRNPVRQG